MKQHDKKRYTVLIVDDDPAVTRMLCRKFIQETSLIPIFTESLQQAVNLLKDKRIQIDVLCTDLYFIPEAQDSKNEIIDGLDLVRLAQEIRGSLKTHIISVWADDEHDRKKADELGINISGWHPKLGITRKDPPWRTIEVELLGNKAMCQNSDITFDYDYDVFLAYNNKDKEIIEQIASDLLEHGVEPWFDKRNLPPGRLFQKAIEDVLPKTKSVAVFISSNGMGPWEVIEQKVAISEFIKREAPVIPVILYAKDSAIELPLFLQQFGWVEFSDKIPKEESISRLLWGIKGIKT